MKYLLFASLIFWATNRLYAQDTLSIVAMYSVTGEAGSAGASCVDMFTIPGYSEQSQNFSPIKNAGDEGVQFIFIQK